MLLPGSWEPRAPIAIAGLVFGEEAVRGELRGQLARLSGEPGASGIESFLAGAGKQIEGVVTSLAGVVTMLIAAVTVVVQLKDALNLVWGAAARPASGLWGFMRKYTVSLAGVLAMGFLVLVSLLITTALAATGEAFSAYFPEALFHLVSLAVSLCVTTILFTMMFKWLPDIVVFSSSSAVSSSASISASRGWNRPMVRQLRSSSS